MLFNYSAPFPGECCLKLVAYTGRPRPNPVSDRRLHHLELIKTEINRRNTQSLKQVSHSISGSLSNDDADGNENGKKAIGLISKTTTLHVHHAFFVHFFAVVARLQRESAWIHVLSRTGTQDNNFLFFSWTLIQSFRIQLQKHLPTFDEVNEME